MYQVMRIRGRRATLSRNQRVSTVGILQYCTEQTINFTKYRRVTDSAGLFVRNDGLFVANDRIHASTSGDDVVRPVDHGHAKAARAFA